MCIYLLTVFGHSCKTKSTFNPQRVRNVNSYITIFTWGALLWKVNPNVKCYICQKTKFGFWKDRTGKSRSWHKIIYLDKMPDVNLSRWNCNDTWTFRQNLNIVWLREYFKFIISNDVSFTDIKKWPEKLRRYPPTKKIKGKRDEERKKRKRERKEMKKDILAQKLKISKSGCCCGPLVLHYSAKSSCRSYQNWRDMNLHIMKSAIVFDI